MGIDDKTTPMHFMYLLSNTIRQDLYALKENAGIPNDVSHR